MKRCAAACDNHLFEPECIGFLFESDADGGPSCKYYYFYKVPAAVGNCTLDSAIFDNAACHTESRFPGAFMRIGGVGGGPELFHPPVWDVPVYNPAVDGYLDTPNLSSPNGMTQTDAEQYRDDWWATARERENTVETRGGGYLGAGLVDAGSMVTVLWQMVPEMLTAPWDPMDGSSTDGSGSRAGVGEIYAKFTQDPRGCSPSLDGRVAAHSVYNLDPLDRSITQNGATSLLTPAESGNYTLVLYQEVTCTSDHAMENCSHYKQRNATYAAQDTCVAVRAMQSIEVVDKSALLASGGGADGGTATTCATLFCLPLLLPPPPLPPVSLCHLHRAL